MLIDGSYTTLANVMPDLQAAATTLGQRLAPFTVTRDSDLEDVFSLHERGLTRVLASETSLDDVAIRSSAGVRCPPVQSAPRRCPLA